jgi:hypothetical protein
MTQKLDKKPGIAAIEKNFHDRKKKSFSSLKPLTAKDI